jgi:chemotaxis protein CheD
MGRIRLSKDFMDRISLKPCEYRICKGPEEIETLLGSCVSVCLYNIKNGQAAMNHFLRACDNGKPDCKTGEYGSLSTPYIIKSLMEIDPDASHYRAQIFGGAAVIKTKSSAYSIGENNINIALEVLAHYRIRIINKDIGGTRGRNIIFDTSTNTVHCRFAGQVSKKYRKKKEE